MGDLAAQNARAAECMTRRIVGPTILMGDGLYFDFEDMDATGMTVEDYAWGLASANRFRGQTRERIPDVFGVVGPRVLYNVCQHVVMLARQMRADWHSVEAVYQGLMHESDEVPWGDIPGPAKALMPAEMKALIKRSGDAIDRRFRVGTEHKNLVKQYDLRMLATEKRDLMPHAGADEWSHTEGYGPFNFRITCWAPDVAVQEFRKLFHELECARHGR